MELLALVLAGLAMVGPFSIDSYLPSFPAIARDFALTPIEVQQTMSAYLVTFALMMLFHGTLSDSFGRRPVILANLALFIVATAGCALARDFTQLLAFRALQGVSAGAGIVVGRAIIRDTYEGFAAQRLMSLVTMLFGIAPAIAPVIGGWLLSRYSWHAIFVFLACYGAALFAVCWFRLPETHPPAARQPFALVPLAASYLRLARSGRLVLLSLATGFNWGGGFLLRRSGARRNLRSARIERNEVCRALRARHRGHHDRRLALRTQRRQGGAEADGRAGLRGHVRLRARQRRLPRLRAGGAALDGGAVHDLRPRHGTCHAEHRLMAIDLFPANRGLAASLQGFLQSACGVVTAGLIAPLVSGHGASLALGMLALVTAGWLAWFGCLRIEARRQMRHASENLKNSGKINALLLPARPS